LPTLEGALPRGSFEPGATGVVPLGLGCDECTGAGVAAPWGTAVFVGVADESLGVFEGVVDCAPVEV